MTELDKKEERIAWASAKNNAVEIAVSTGKVSKEDIVSWANWLYHLEPEVKIAVNDKASQKQIDYIKSLCKQKNINEPPNLDKFTPEQASEQIEKLLSMPRYSSVPRGDFSSDVEGEKSVDYDEKTGQLK